MGRRSEPKGEGARPGQWSRVSRCSQALLVGLVYASALGCGDPEEVSTRDPSQPSPTCSDGVQNQGEQGVDCAGPCAACRQVSTQGFRLIPAGSFVMGSPSDEEGRGSDEGPTRQVTLRRSFYLQEMEVTQGQWSALMGNNPSSFSGCGASCPVEKVSWYDALEYVNKLSESEGLEMCYMLSGCSGRPGAGDYRCSQVSWPKGLDCEGYRLPTEAEWEYAARGGTTGVRYGSLDDIAWYDGNSRDKTQPVGRKQANAYGLYDMLGNVWEWTWDAYGDYSSDEQTDPIAGGLTQTGSVRRALRGCSWNLDARYCRAAVRFWDSPGNRATSLGLRAARSKR